MGERSFHFKHVFCSKSCRHKMILAVGRQHKGWFVGCERAQLAHHITHRFLIAGQIGQSAPESPFFFFRRKRMKHPVENASPAIARAKIAEICLKPQIVRKKMKALCDRQPIARTDDDRICRANLCSDAFVDLFHCILLYVYSRRSIANDSARSAFTARARSARCSGACV